MKRKKSTILLASVALLAGIAIHEMTEEQEVEAAGVSRNMLEPDWEGVDHKLRRGKPKRLRMTKSNPHYDYYRKMTGNNRRPRLFKESYRGVIDYYTPIGSGSNLRYTNIHKPEQLWRNSSNNKAYISSWTKTPVNTANQLIDRNRSAHAKKESSLSGETKGYFRFKTIPSDKVINHGMFKGRKGEWRYMGYSESSGDVGNPSFPADIVSQGFFTGGGVDIAAQRTFWLNPWAKNNPHFIRGYVAGGTEYDHAKKGTREYNIKRQAMVRLLNERPNYRRVNNSPEYWMRRYSLQNDPSDGSMAYMVGVLTTGTYHFQFVDALSPAVRNLTVLKQEVVASNGEVIRTFERKPGELEGKLSSQKRPLISGEKVTIRTTVRNTTKSGANSTTVGQPKLQIGYRMGSGAKTQLRYFGEQSMTQKFVASSGRRLNAGQSTEYKQEITVPSSSNIMGIYSEVHEDSFWEGDNTVGDDDFAQMALAVNNETGNFRNQGVVLVDNETGKEVSKPVPGKAYKLRFYFDYKADRNASRNVSVNINYQINRELPRGQKDSYSGVVRKASFRPTRNGRYSLLTKDAIVYETGTFGVSSTLNVNRSDANYNRNSADDKSSSSFRYNYDISMKNAVLLPQVSSHTNNGEMKYLLKFDVDYAVPSHVKNHEKDVKFEVNVGGRKKTVTEHIRQGHNPNVTVEISVPSNGKNKEVKATVLANSDRQVYETNTANNRIETKANVSNASKVRPYSGGVKKRNNWTQHAQVHKWNSKNVSYKLFNRNTTYSFPFYTPNGSPTNQQIGLSESYEIKHVWFRSKTTQDLKEGPKRDGWVDLTKEPGKIKAGYGYELKVDVEYQTDAFAKMPKQTASQWVRPRLTKPNLPNNIYIQTPDNEIHSVDGDGGTAKALKHTRKDASNGSKTEWTFEIAPRRVLGVNTLGKFYIGEDVSNGTYDLTVFTPQTAGVLGKMSNQTNVLNLPLYDQKSNLKIQVVGSATDDVNDHITQ